MSHALTPVRTLSQAWLCGLEVALSASGGRRVHLITTITDPGTEIDSVREALDHSLRSFGVQSVDTVAHTIFPKALYDDPGIEWKPGLASESEQVINAAAERLYDRYRSMLPLLLTDPGNKQGTYFSRMISWPGKEVNGINQLCNRINRLRSEHRSGRRTHNTLDIDLSAYCVPTYQSPIGVQTYAVTDERIRGFPCLVHVDLTLFEGKLHCTAVYRHHYLVSKAYGNYLGLSWLMQFLSQQSGYEVGELVVHSTLADAQPGDRPKPRQLLEEARNALARATGITQ